MMMRIILLLTVAMSSFTAVLAASEMMSARMFVHVRPEMNSFWRTATNNVVELPVDMPRTAKTATLHVEGSGYERTYSGLPGGVFRLELPEASSPERENVYRLTLSFDDGTERTAVLGVIEGMRTADEGCSTRCRFSGDGLTWKKTASRFVIPVPYGTGSISVPGALAAVVPGEFDGAQGWCALAAGAYGKLSIAAALPDSEMSADVLVCNPGCVMVLR
jgi:hypothetical protein